MRAGADPVLSLFGCVIIAYGIMLVWYYRLLIQYFPQGRGTSLAFYGMDRQISTAYGRRNLYRDWSVYSSDSDVGKSYRSTDQGTVLFSTGAYDVPALLPFYPY